jgi:hypothetical protein
MVKKYSSARPKFTPRTLQKAGLIAYRRGNVTILNRKSLEAAACELLWGAATAD